MYGFVNNNSGAFILCDTEEEAARIGAEMGLSRFTVRRVYDQRTAPVTSTVNARTRQRREAEPTGMAAFLAGGQ